MTAAAPHRGPDGVRHWVDGNAGLAHQAFHVTPESVRERQPLASADGRLTLVADARIDNRDELIRALAGEGLPADPTDADLILAAYRRWREACPERLLGDFVFAVWDKVGADAVPGPRRAGRAQPVLPLRRPAVPVRVRGEPDS